ncbi:uncharacterized protein TNCV_1119551 [Trichonephila clavipes]|uniref:Mutator-like transposase domain-containing protein n=1 Tax=Trichonephila clavipes TaxID=2585209 RepID=A0A8X6T5K1_TRICX|nr:uncharacterized protein TNCV_1119551 [Trichonephila clavipes]
MCIGLKLNIRVTAVLKLPRTKKFRQVKRRLIRSNTSVNAESERVDVSASKKKIEKSEVSFKDYEDNFSVETQSRYVIIDLNMLNDIFNNIAKCRYCDKSFCFDAAENKSSCKGLATSVSATCKYCGSGHTSNTVSDGYEVNLRFVYGMRCIGMGKSAAQIFCALMNLPPPPAKFERLYTPIFKALETVSSRSMVNSVNEAVIENEHNKNIAIALDGTWQKRGHSSKNGVVTATSLDNGKVIDFEFLSKYCFECKSVMDAVICFNEDEYARTEVLKALKINPGVNACEGLRKIDNVRICEAEMAVRKASKEARTTKRQIKGKQDGCFRTVNAR